MRVVLPRRLLVPPKLRQDQIHGKERGPGRQAGGCAIAAPWPISRLLAEPGSDRVEDDIARELDEVLALDEACAEAALEEVAVEPVPAVEQLGIRAIEAL